MPRRMGVRHWHRVQICTDAKLMSHWCHISLISSVILEELTFHNISEKGWSLYIKLRSIHHFKDLNKGRVLYTWYYGSFLKTYFLDRQKFLWRFFNFDFFLLYLANNLLGHGWSVNRLFWHNKQLNVVGIYKDLKELRSWIWTGRIFGKALLTGSFKM